MTVTSDEIKELHSMREIVESYGIHIDRKGFCKCPFHQGDRTASMRIYKNDYNCYGCGANGDIFTFIQQMDGIEFKDAFYKLGGEYPDHDRKPKSRFNQKIAAYNMKSKQDESEKKRKKCISELYFTNAELNFCLLVEKLCSPLSDDWCWAVNRKEYLLYKQQELLKERKSYP